MPTRRGKPKATASATVTKTPPRRSRKARVSFDDPTPAADAAPVDWVYRTGDPKATPPSPPRRLPTAPRRSTPVDSTGAPSAASSTPEVTPAGRWLTARVDMLLLPVSLALLTVLAPLSWVSSRRTDR